MGDFNDAIALEWDSEIQDDGGVFELIPSGEYDFTVKGFERARYNGGARIPACNKAVLTLSIETSTGERVLKTDLLLVSSLEWKISSFFRSIGLKEHGSKLIMDWNKVPGSKGRLRLKQRTYTNQYGETRTFNEVDSFLDRDKEADNGNDPDEDAPF